MIILVIFNFVWTKEQFRCAKTRSPKKDQRKFHIFERNRTGFIFDSKNLKYHVPNGPVLQVNLIWRYIWPKKKRLDNYLQVIHILLYYIKILNFLAKSFTSIVKECDKMQIIKEKKVKYVHLEKKILAEYLNDNPFFVTLCFTFQDEQSLCNLKKICSVISFFKNSNYFLVFGLSYCSNGDLLSYIKKLKTFSLEKAQFYSAEIVAALEYMHSKMIVHRFTWLDIHKVCLEKIIYLFCRDLKPENILLDENFHIKLTDFGTARILDDQESKIESDTTETNEGNRPIRRRNSFVGTAQFVAPECLHGKSPHIGSDLWALGCIVFQMITGKHLFAGRFESFVRNFAYLNSYRIIIFKSWVWCVAKSESNCVHVSRRFSNSGSRPDQEAGGGRGHWPAWCKRLQPPKGPWVFSINQLAGQFEWANTALIQHSSFDCTKCSRYKWTFLFFCLSVFFFF